MQKLLMAVGFALLLCVNGCSTAPKTAQAPVQNTLKVFNMADMHSGYDAYPLLLSGIDHELSNAPQQPVVFVINGDFFEAGSVVAKKSEGKLDLAFLAELKKRGDVVFNVGNHDFDILPVNDFIREARALGVNVIGTFASTQLNTPLSPYTDISVGDKRIRFIGVDTDHGKTFPLYLRTSLNIPAPLAWMQLNYAPLSGTADYTVLLSHAGLQADKEILAFLSQQTFKPIYMTGAHDHLTLQQRVDGIPYLHTGFKGQRLVVADIQLNTAPDVQVHTLLTEDIKDKNQAFASLLEQTRKDTLTPQDLAIVGTVPEALNLSEAVDWTLQVMREKTGADVALFNHSSFGSGLPKGPLPLYRFNQFMRFENKLMMTTVDGKTLRAILANANQHLKNDIAQLSGDFVYANNIEPQDDKYYNVVCPDWVSMRDNQQAYLGMNLPFHVVQGLTIKGILKDALRQTN